MKLYSYWRSSAAYRVRIALNLKNIPHEISPVHLLNNGGEQKSEIYGNLNPNHLVPTLVDGDLVLNQSLAILQYLDAKFPSAPLSPKSINDRALVQSLALDIACEMHPLNNLRVQQYLSTEMAVTDEKKSQWVHHWMNTGFVALEERLQKTAGDFCFKNDVTLADICLIPQIYNAKRVGIDLTPYPTISAITERCNTLVPFIDAMPQNQIDAQ
jgi:maleylacetoacetate isomerase/maleylpyruvate isomerase